MQSTGTEPGDFVDCDMDLIEAERRGRMRAALEASRQRLQAELATDLQIVADGSELVLRDGAGIRFRATLDRQGRLTVTDERLRDVI